MLIEITTGILIALFFASAIIRISPKNHLSFWATGLILAALIYVGFAFFGKNYVWLSIECFGVLLYAVPAILSLKRSKYWLAAGWGLHIFWDLLLHYEGHPGFIPAWYPGICLGFDLAIAGFVIWSIRKAKAEIQAPTVISK